MIRRYQLRVGVSLQARDMNQPGSLVAGRLVQSLGNPGGKQAETGEVKSYLVIGVTMSKPCSKHI